MRRRFLRSTNRPHAERGAALVVTMFAMMIVLALLGSLLATASTDALINANVKSTARAHFIAEAGIHQAAAWFNAQWGNPTSGLYVLPEQNTGASPSPTKLSYSTSTPVYTVGALSSSDPEDREVTSVKIGDSSGNLRNVVLSAASDTTYPASYTVTAVNSAGAATTYTYSKVTSDFQAKLTNRSFGNGAFSVKAILLSFVPPSSGSTGGKIVWKVISTGTDDEGGTVTLTALLSAQLTAVTGETTTTSTVTTTTLGDFPSGLISRGEIYIHDNAVSVDSYRSSMGAYNASIGANKYTGQIGTTNKGSRGDMRSNGEIGAITGDGKIHVFKPETYNGTAASTLPDTALFHPIVDKDNNALTTRVAYAQSPLTFPPVAVTPSTSTTDRTWTTGGTIPSNTRNLTVASAKKTPDATLPGGNYGALTLTDGTLRLGSASGSVTTYNFSSFNMTGGTLYIDGPVVINIDNGLTLPSKPNIGSGLRPGNIKWNVNGTSTVSIGGNGDLVGSFYAPNARLKIGGTGDLYGTFTGAHLEFSGNAGIHIDEDAVSGVKQSVTTTTTTTSSSTSTVGYTIYGRTGVGIVK